MNAFAVPLVFILSLAGVFNAVRLWPRLHPRKNFRGTTVYLAGSAFVVLVFVAEVACFAIGQPAVAIAVFLAGQVMSLLGLLDDLRGDRAAGGFRGHLRALTHGQITTGVVKMIGGGLVALAAAFIVGARGPGLIAGGALIALSANLINLFDLRPGRAAKATLVYTALLLLAAPVGAAAIILGSIGGGTIGFMPRDLRERVMMGDAGANLLGALLGLVCLISVAGSMIWAVVGILLVANLASELVSFSKVIESTAPLRWFDQLGRRP